MTTSPQYKSTKMITKIAALLNDLEQEGFEEEEQII